MAKKILLIGLMVGLLDALAASIHAYLASGIIELLHKDTVDSNPIHRQRQKKAGLQAIAKRQ
jgi:hypothetical protein